MSRSPFRRFGTGAALIVLGGVMMLVAGIGAFAPITTPDQSCGSAVSPEQTDRFMGGCDGQLQDRRILVAILVLGGLVVLGVGADGVNAATAPPQPPDVDETV